ncbi:uncharacterized protein [Takifugu rubripes]|uniref:uncharacterized protein n=1 Tax=Takifugu rubripes TaxID=31033 RepID=UPI0011460F95|nr:uncharacterized protein LOC115246948 [Takifugu rubripes]
MLGKPQEEGVFGLPNILNATHPASDQVNTISCVGTPMGFPLKNIFVYLAPYPHSVFVEFTAASGRCRRKRPYFGLDQQVPVAGKEYVATRGTTEDTWTGFVSRNSLRACLLKDLEYPLVERARNSVLVASMKSPWKSTDTLFMVDLSVMDGLCRLSELRNSPNSSCVWCQTPQMSSRLSMSRVNKNELEGTCNLETFWMKSAARRNDVRPAPLGRILMDFREQIKKSGPGLWIPHQLLQGCGLLMAKVRHHPAGPEFMVKILFVRCDQRLDFRGQCVHGRSPSGPGSERSHLACSRRSLFVPCVGINPKQ